MQRKDRKHKKDVTKYQDEIKQLQSLIKNPPKPAETVEEIMSVVGEHIDPRFHKLTSSQIRLFKSHKHGRRYNDEDKVRAISLYYQSPKAYKYINEKWFFLPHQRTVNRWLQGMTFQPGFNNDIFDLMKERVSKMSRSERVCSLLLDEVSLKEGLTYNETDDLIVGLEDFAFLGRTKEVANQALVFMVRGIASNWKQPLFYFLARDQTKSPNLTILVKECINMFLIICMSVY